MKIEKTSHLDILVTQLESEEMRDKLYMHINNFQFITNIRAYRGREQYNLNIDDISHFITDNKAVYCYAFGSKYRIEDTLREIVESNKLIIRVNKQTAINIKNVEKIKPLFNGKYNITMKSDEIIELSRTYNKDVLQKIGEYYA